MTKIWQRVGNQFFLRDISDKIDILENKVYILQQRPDTGELYLTESTDKFKFDFKVYALEEKFIQRVLTRYKNKKSNMGILLNGVKGTGKSVTAKIIANELQQPVILLNNVYGNVNSFISSIPQDVTLFIDEYDKVYKGNMGAEEDEYEDHSSKMNDASLLPLMDGSFDNGYKRMFILTTNRPWININMKSRPGRIYYIKNFDDLTFEQVKEIMDDLLVYKEYTDEIWEYIKPLEIITVDIVKAIIAEVNLFNASPAEACEDLNIEFKKDTYELIEERNGLEVYLGEIEESIYQEFEKDSKKNWETPYIRVESTVYKNRKKPDYKKNIFTLGDYHDKSGENIKVHFRKKQNYHKIYTF